MSVVQRYKQFKAACCAWCQYEVDETYSLDVQHCLFDDKEYMKGIKELENYSVDEFITDINIPIEYKCNLYKFVTTTKKYEMNDIIKLEKPNSWFESKDLVTNYMSDSYDNVVFMELDTTNVNGVFNKFNDCDEREYILTPMTLKVGTIDGNLLHVTVNK